MVLSQGSYQVTSARPAGALVPLRDATDRSTPRHEGPASRRQESGRETERHRRHHHLSVVGIADGPDRGEDAVVVEGLGVVVRGVLGEFNRSSQRSSGRSCDEREGSEVGSGGSAGDAVAGPSAGRAS